MNNDDKYISLIIKAAEDIAHYKKEIIALRYALVDAYPDLKYELLSDLTSYLELDDLYIKIVNDIKYDHLDNEEYINEIKKLTVIGYNDKYPFSI